MATVKIILLKTKVNKDRSHPVVIRLSSGRNRNYIFLNLFCKPGQWNDGLCRFNTNHKKFKQHNRILANHEERIEEIMDYFKLRNLEFSAELFKRKFRRKLLINTTVFNYFDAIVNDLKSNNKIGNAAAIKDAKNALKRFYNGHRLMFQDIDITLLTKYKNWLQAQKNFKDEYLSDRTVSVYLRSLRSVYYRAMGEGLISEELNPFGKRKFSVNKGLNLRTRKRAITKEEIMKIYYYKGTLIDARNIFMFSYLTAGMNFIDMAYLKWSNIVNNRIEYKRLKTRKEFSIKITDPIQKILDYYKPYGSEYIFPILQKTHKTEIQKRDRIKTANKKLNHDLSQIAKELDINAHLTSYVARHSMATVLYKTEGQNVSEIQELMGHSREDETRIYLESIDQEKKDKLQDKLL